nr:MAG TPA: hypothetical protein [Caudoviricetes sp.]
MGLLVGLLTLKPLQPLLRLNSRIPPLPPEFERQKASAFCLFCYWAPAAHACAVRA